MGALQATRLRIAQFAAARSPVVPPGCDEIVRRVLSAPLREAFAATPEPDRAHQCRVALGLCAAGTDDPALLAAALLHDIGKEVGGRPPSLADRVALVALGRFAPSLLLRMSTGAAPARLVGLAALARHAETGADRLRSIGADPYLVWLVRHHHREDIRDDPGLALLQAIDHSVP